MTWTRIENDQHVRMLSLAGVEIALGWPPGAVWRYMNGESDEIAVDPVGPPEQDAPAFRYQRPEGLTDREWDDLRRQHADYWDWLVERAARER